VPFLKKNYNVADQISPLLIDLYMHIG